MQSRTTTNRLTLTLISFLTSFVLTCLFSWNISQGFSNGIISVIAAYFAVLIIDKRHRHQEMIVIDSLNHRIKELEGLKHHFLSEVHQLENHHHSLVQESNKLQNQVAECRNTRDSLNRELSTYSAQRKQLEVNIHAIQADIENLERNKIDLNKTFSNLSLEKRRLEANNNALRTEISQLQNIIHELLQERIEVENNLVLLERIKPSLEEKLYDLRVNIQELEYQFVEQNNLISAKKREYEDFDLKFEQLQQQISHKETELRQIQDQVHLLEVERDTLQNQVWELVQQEEINQPQEINVSEQNRQALDIFPFSELLESIDETSEIEAEWLDFSKALTASQIQALITILEEQNPYPLIKKIAEENITMPNILIDSINEEAQIAMGENIIDTNSDLPMIYPEYIFKLQQMIENHRKKSSLNI